MKYQSVLTLTALLLTPPTSADWNWSSFTNDACLSSCQSELSDFSPSGISSFCADPTATSCLSSASCSDSLPSLTASLSSLCSAASTLTADAAWSSWASSWATAWPRGSATASGAWTKGGPFGGNWGPWGNQGSWTTGGSWQGWWDGNGNDCPGSEWEGWTDGPWSTNADWTTWTACTATTTPSVYTTTVSGSAQVITSLEIQVAQATGGAVQSTGSGGSSGAGSDGVPKVLLVFGGLLTGFVGIIAVL